ncbi:MAG: phosphate signaling complex protein PhoU [Chloroherpetonaceae bacterium]
MHKTFEQSLNELQDVMRQLAGQAEESVIDAIESLKSRDVALAKSVIERDEHVDRMDINADALASTILARQQPVASDLRLIIGAMKIANDLERIGDHAVNIAESAITLSTVSFIPESDNLFYMAALVQEMLLAATECFAERNTIIARGIINSDTEVDEYNKIITQNLIEGMSTQKVDVKAGMDVVRICKNLERIADLSVNIAEDVIYIHDGKFVRHNF